MFERGAIMVATKQAAAAITDLRQAVLSQIRQDPNTKETDVFVTAEEGIVTLTGDVKTTAERIAVETAAKEVRGVRAVANELVVKPTSARSSTEIARDLLKALKSHIFLASEDITVVVRDGRVILEGQVHQELQKMLAEAQVKRLRGVFGISNQLETTLQTSENTDAVNGSAWIETTDLDAGQ
jgi:osmotically-inducible protein OsmY